MKFSDGCVLGGDPELLTADGFDEAILGIVSGSGQPDRVCYDYELCCQVLMKRDKMSREDAIEFMDFNVTNAYAGERTPLFLHRGLPHG